VQCAEISDPFNVYIYRFRIHTRSCHTLCRHGARTRIPLDLCLNPAGARRGWHQPASASTSRYHPQTPALKKPESLGVWRYRPATSPVYGGLRHMVVCVIWQSASYGSLRHMAVCVIWQDASYGSLRHMAGCVIGSLRHMAGCVVENQSQNKQTPTTNQ
jgi:hypothetical protein